jgi:hypothetical protein
MAVSDAMPRQRATALESTGIWPGVSAAAEQREAGELLAYEIEEPVTRRASNLDDSDRYDKVEGAPLSIYNHA